MPGQPGAPDGGGQEAPPPPDGEAARGMRARADEAPGRRVGERKKQFLVAPQQAPGLAAIGPFGMPSPALQPPSLQAVEKALNDHPDIDVVRTVGTAGMGPLGIGAAAGGGTLVARMTDDKARALQQQTQGQLVIERDQHLLLHEVMPRQPAMVNSLAVRASATLAFRMVVLGKDGTPLPDAEVALFGGLLPAGGMTDARGEVTVTLYGDSPHMVSGVYVKPRADYWSFYQRDPDLGTDEANVIGLRPLSDWPQLPDFPKRSAIGWGQRAMRLDQLPPNFRGQGVKIAVIDSGADNRHPDLKRIQNGVDIIGKNPDSWNQDVLGHGSHCSGVIGGADPTFGIHGFAPEAEIHVCKLFPGGQVSQLIEALDYCIEQQIDVVNLSLGGVSPSPALEQRIVRAKQAGIACIAATGNSGGPVQYPAASPNVLAVAAIGKFDEFPRDSYHVETLSTDVDASGYFTAKFSCFGPEVDVCAPGVAIVSSVPPANFAAWDGTSMAAPHVTGLAALMLAHHPALQAQGGMRSAQRVDALFDLIRRSGRRVTQSGALRTGAGMPDAPTAFGLGLPGQQAMQAPLGSMAGAMAANAMFDPAINAAYLGMGAPRAPAFMAPLGFGYGGTRVGW
ncbi:S8 family peptidase [Massilia forsythiae]|uniref:S8 family peptidase n=2 Tax=Massilia forsythiae TaxID=2728020 RepID=A0A7Z2W2A9_9BURK|nr:S8 family peptidase [Massilia forsythiae]